jgi:nitroimidazol reductase NimA-like FMN-containing flavoprotein (pyridoxamine 5'-phosphate oxidase superfamily)
VSSKSTATPENALSKEEIDERLGSTALARLATYRADGMIHLTPIWFDWDGAAFRLTLGAGHPAAGLLRHEDRGPTRPACDLEHM